MKKNKNLVTIVAYHYVRDLKYSRYPAIKGLSTEFFKGQLNYILKNYNVIRMEDLIAAVKFKKNLPKNSLLLTFDDGYKDHFEVVFPILSQLGLQGSFFVPVGVIKNNYVINVNKIHFILASVKDNKLLIKNIFSILDKYRKEYSLLENSDYYKKLARKTPSKRFDTKEVIFIKLLLQKELPDKLRNIIVDSLFKEYVYKDEKVFSKELYMNVDQIKCMKMHGMYIGNHGFNHSWWDTLSYQEQEREIDLSLGFFKSIDCDVSEWAICYPHGFYDSFASLTPALKDKGCVLGLTTHFGIADLNRDGPYVLPRINTNDLPKKL